MADAHRARAGTRGPAHWRLRALLAASTALTALAAIQPAHAQAPLATPAGGVVVAGSARIAQAPGATAITQSSARAAINWQSFNVGSRATVAFQQPSSQAVTLNRVIAPDPSMIAGRITANGSIVLVNPDGVVFANGAEVNAAGLVVSAPGITNQNFMAGRMIFDQPANPNARIVNRGSLSVAEAGLAALVAPQVANSGLIAAKLGSVVLAGARTATLDLYGDGLVSIDVQGAVRTVPVGPNGKPVKALVTNSGTIVAEGGTVLLTARAVDGLVQNLVNAGGTISANGASGGAAGTVLVQGVGGSIRIAGTLTASGEGPGGTGGAIGLDASGRVAVANTARIDASGPAGGGLVAVGTTLARAKGGPGTAAGLTAAHVRIAPGATISADATVAGNGGRVTVLSSVTTADHGAITAEGGSLGGSGGFVEISGHDLALDGTVNTSAPLGAMGTILLDPFNLQIVASGANDGDVTTSPVNGVASGSGNTTPGSTDTVSASVIEALVGNVTLQALNNLEVSTNLALPGPTQSLLMEAGNNITIDAGVVVSAPGGITAAAAFDFATGSTVITNPGGITVNGTLTIAGTDTTISLSSGTGGITIGPAGLVDAGPAASPLGFVSVTSGGALSESGNGAINANAFDAFVSSATLNGPNSINTVDDFTASTGGISLSDTFAPLTIFTMSAPNTQTISVADDQILVPDSEIFAGTIALGPFHDGVPITLEGDNADPSTGFAFDNFDFFVFDAPTLKLVQPGTAPINITSSNRFTSEGIAITTLALVTAGPVSEDATGSITVDVLTGSAGNVSLNNVNNNILNVGDFSSTGSLSLVDTPTVGGVAQDLTVIGTVAGQTGVSIDVTNSGLDIGALASAGLIGSPAMVSLTTAGDIFEFNGSVAAGTLAGSATSLLLDESNAIGTLGAFSLPASSFMFLTDTIDLTVSGPVSAVNSFVSLSTAGNLTLAGTLDATGDAVLLSAGGSISEPGGAILANVLSGTSGGAALFSGANAIGTLAAVTGSGGSSSSAFVAGGNFTLVDSMPLTITAPITVPAGDTIALVTDSLTEGSQTTFVDDRSVTVFGALQATGGEVSIEPFTASVPVALVGAGAQPAGTLSLDDALLAAITAGTLALTSFGSEPITISGANQLGGLTDPNTGLASGVNALLVNAGGAFSEAAGASLNVGVLGGSALGASLGGANLIGTLDGFSSSTGFALLDSESLEVLGKVSDPTGITLAIAPGSLTLGSGATAGTLSSAGTVNLQVPGGTILAVGGGVTAGTLSGTASALAVFGFGSEISALGSFAVSGAGSELSLTSGVPLAISGPVTAGTFFVADPGAVTETASGLLNVGVLTGNAGSVALGQANQVGILEEFASTGGFELTDVTALTVLGEVTDPTGITLAVAPGSLTLGSGATGGTLSSAGIVSLQVPDGTITEPNGAVTAGTLAGTAAEFAQLGTADVATLGSFSVSGAAGELALTNSVPLTISGPVSAAFLDIAAPGTLTLSGTIFTTGLPLADQSGASPALPGSVLEVLSGGVFQELGTSVIAPLGAGGATVRIQLPAAGGAASFANLQAGGVNLVLALGPGAATGTMASGGLLVIGTGGSANLFGSVGGISGPAAAAVARIQPATTTNYLFNRCVIQTAICSPLFVQVPQGSPNLVGTGGGPSLSPAVTLPPIVLLTIPAVVGESWTDAGGFPLPNIARLDF